MNTEAHNKILSPDTAINQAKDFLRQYYRDTTNHVRPDQPMAHREKDVLQQLRLTGTYELTKVKEVDGV